MKVKKLLALLACVLAAFVLLSMGAAAEEIVYCSHDSSNYRWVITDQTCTREGYKEHICDICYAENPDAKPFETVVIPKHSFVHIYVGKVPNCQETGYEVFYCEWCNAIEEREIPMDKDNHMYGDWTVIEESTCKDEGLQERFCSRCGYRDTAAVPTDSSKHDAGDNPWETVREATCYIEGAEKSLCRICNTVFTREIAIHSDYKNNEAKYALVEHQDANCAQPDADKYLCRDCGISFNVVGQRIPDAHDFSEEKLWYYSENANCKNPGTVTKYCKNYPVHKIEEVYAPHFFEGAEVIVKPATCYEDGEKTVKCLYCDEKETVIIPASHSFSAWTLTGTCETGGTATRTCDCKEVTETISFNAGTHLNYTYNPDNITYPTCLNDGFLETICHDCGRKIRVFLPELDSKGEHTPGKWEVTEEATCDKSGHQRLHCAYCDAIIKEEVIPQREHSCVIVLEGVAAGCETVGMTDALYCTLCETLFEQEVIPALGHNFVEQNTPEEGAVRICHTCYEYEVGEVTCKCLCHNSNGLAKTLWKFVTFFCKLFGFNQECKCGIMHY